MYETIVFDLDGTLLDTLDDLCGAVNYALRSFGYQERTKAQVQSFIGNGIVKLMERAVGQKDARFDEILGTFKAYYKEHCADNTKPYPHILTLLKILKAQGKKTAVLSNKADFATQALAKQYFGDLLDVAMGENEPAGIAKKPAPDGLNAVLAKLGADKKTCVYVGDSEVDIQTAKNAGVDCVSVTWGFKDKAFLQANGAQILIDEPFALLQVCQDVCFDNVESKIGNTPLVRLKNIENALGLHARLYAKMENNNVGGSIKDRAALYIINDAEQTGKLQKGGTVIEATSGNTGIALALVAKSRGYKAVIVMPDSMSEERRALLKRYGAELVLTDGKKGMQGAVDEAARLVQQISNSILAGQFDNPANARAHYQTTGPEIDNQLQGAVHMLVAGVGTGGTITGIGKYLKEKRPQTQVIAVEPKKSPLLSKGRAGAHGLQGIGANFLPAVLDRTVYDEVVCVDEKDAFAWVRKLLDMENIFVGISSGAALTAAIEMAKREENAGKNIVVIFPDDGGRYVSTGIFD